MSKQLIKHPHGTLLTNPRILWQCDWFSFARSAAQDKQLCRNSFMATCVGWHRGWCQSPACLTEKTLREQFSGAFVKSTWRFVERCRERDPVGRPAANVGLWKSTYKELGGKHKGYWLDWTSGINENFRWAVFGKPNWRSGMILRRVAHPFTQHLV